MSTLIRFAISTFLTIASISSLSAYDWERHIPDWQAFVPCEDQCKTYYGPVSRTGYLTQDLTVYGPLSLRDSIIEGTLTIYGPGILETTTVKGPLVLFGVIKATNSSLSDIHAATTDLRLISSTANDIIILKNSDDSSEQQHIFLNGKTTVTGSITFERGDGLVTIAPTARFSGTISGGTVIKE